MQPIDFLSYLNQPPTPLKIALDLLSIVLLTAICYLAVWLSSKVKPLADEDHAKKYRLWGILYVALLCLLPYILPQRGMLFHLLSLVTSVMHPDMAYMVYILHNAVLRPLAIAILLAVGEYFLLRKVAEDRKKLKKALKLQAVISIVLHIIFRSVNSFIISVGLRLFL